MADEEPLEEAGEHDESAASDGEPVDPEALSDASTVELASGEIITAPSPELARVISAAVDGTPIMEAFQQQGITIPVPGSVVSEPLDPSQLRAGDIGVFGDRHALALGNGKAVLNNQIQPTETIAGPNFLGWEHPPQPGTVSASVAPDAPAPTRPAVTVPPSG